MKTTTVKYENGYWVDGDNNKWSSDILDAWDEHGALELAKTLVNCKNCIDCIECEDCEDCIDCEMCSCCYDCVGCVNCDGCENCYDCAGFSGIKSAHKGEIEYIHRRCRLSY